MRLSLLSSSLLVLSIATVGCMHRPGPARVETRLSGTTFSSIVANGAVDAEITVGAARSIVLECDPDLVPYVRTRVEDDALVIDSSFPDRNQLKITFGPETGCTVKVGVPKLTALTVNGSGDVRVVGTAEGLRKLAVAGSGDVSVDGARTETIELTSTGSGDVTIGALSADEVRTQLNGSGEIQASGKAKSFHLVSNGSGEVKARSLKTEESHVQVNGSADVELFATRRADVTTNGSGDVVVVGNPTERRADVHGSGEVHWE